MGINALKTFLWFQKHLFQNCNQKNQSWRKEESRQLNGKDDGLDQ